MRCRSLADRSFSASLPSSRELPVGSPCDNAKPQGNHLTANAVGKLKAIDGSFAQERCLRGLGTRETDHEREQIRDVIGRMTAPNGLEPRQARRTQVAAATWSCRSDTCKLRHAKRTARLGNVQSAFDRTCVLRCHCTCGSMTSRAKWFAIDRANIRQRKAC